MVSVDCHYPVAGCLVREAPSCLAAGYIMERNIMKSIKRMYESDVVNTPHRIEPEAP